MATRREGLTTDEARSRLATSGPNLLPRPRPPSPLLLLAKQMTHLLALMLWVAAALALLAGLAALAIAIVIVVVLNGAVAFAMEYRADRAAEKLRALLPASARVRRDGVVHAIRTEALVPGDVVLLGPGDRVGADMQLIEAEQIALDESLLTGESAPVARGIGQIVHAGTFVVQGEAEASVTATGADTRLAKIAELTRSARRPPSPLALQLRRLVRGLALIACSIGVVLGAVALTLGFEATEAFLFALGVTVALVPEGLLPTVTLSLAHGAQRMAARRALVRRLDAVETLGATTFICTDKTGTLTQNRMEVVEAWSAQGTVTIAGEGYAPEAEIAGQESALAATAEAAASAARCVTGRAVQRDGRWINDGDPMEAALDALASRMGARPDPREQLALRRPFTPERMLSAVVAGGVAHVLGAPERILERCAHAPAASHQALSDIASRGRRVLAVARRDDPDLRDPERGVEDGLRLVALLGLEDPPRPDVAEALAACRRACIRVAMITGDHPATAAAIAREIGLLGPGGTVLDASSAAIDDATLAASIDHPDGAVLARVGPADKLRVARALRERGHVVAMTGDGVNDAPALREADVGVAMGASGSDVAREAADLVLLDDHFGTIVSAIELGRATFTNIRRFLTYHLTDNVAELAPFAVWALSGGNVPLAIGVLQVLALDIGTDILPAIALGAEPPAERALSGPPPKGQLLDKPLLIRAFGVLGLFEASAAMLVFLVVLASGGWQLGDEVERDLLLPASGAAFATIALCQMANAFACRSASRPAWRLAPATNPLLIAAVCAELALLLVFVGVPGVAELLGGTWPPLMGWLMGLSAAAALLALDALHKRALSRRPEPSRRRLTPAHGRNRLLGTPTQASRMTTER
jgi:magnesium-transporting ATPase (P-type)